MAAPMRSVLCYATKAENGYAECRKKTVNGLVFASRICCSRIHFNTGSRVLHVSMTPLSTQAKPCQVQLQRPISYSLARSPLIRTGPSSQTRLYSQLSINHGVVGTYSTGLLQRLTSSPGVSFPQHQPSRTVVRFSRNKGKKKSVKAVTDRFYRFSNGLWLRTIAGRNKKRWKKSPARKRRTKWHVFCSKTQSKKLDLMVSSYWKERRYFPDDPLEPFQDRHYKGLNFFPGAKAMRWRKDV